MVNRLVLVNFLQTNNIELGRKHLLTLKDNIEILILFCLRMKKVQWKLDVRDQILN